MQRKTTPRNALIAGAIASAAVAIISELSASRRIRLTVLASAITAGMAVMPADTPKAKSTEARVNALVPQIGALKSGQGRFGGFSGANQSQSMGGGTVITYDPQNSSNEGGSNSSTSSTGANTGGQVGGAAAHTHPIPHTHSMTHHHTQSSDLTADFNKLQASFSDICGRLNTMYSTLQGSSVL
jgi:hypothetical protein